MMQIAGGVNDPRAAAAERRARPARRHLAASCATAAPTYPTSAAVVTVAGAGVGYATILDGRQDRRAGVNADARTRGGLPVGDWWAPERPSLGLWAPKVGATSIARKPRRGQGRSLDATPYPLANPPSPASAEPYTPPAPTALCVLNTPARLVCVRTRYNALSYTDLRLA
ncbi:unnamed protein product, partial [Iphiclides podalirius]